MGIGLVFGQQLFDGGFYGLGGGAVGLPAVAEGGAAMGRGWGWRGVD